MPEKSIKTVRIFLIFLIGFTRSETVFSADEIYPHAVVATDHPAASQAGVEVLQKGGNVVDAAVASSFALSVVRPESCGIGGGGFMVIWNASIRKPFAIDYREIAPKESRSDQFYRDSENSETDSPGRTGHRAVAVPGNVAGLCYANQYFGKLPLKDVITPAIRLAEQGVKTDPFAQKVQKEILEDFQKSPGYQLRFQPLWKDYLNSGKLRDRGELIYSPQLEVLKRIQKEGAKGFYTGEVASAIVDEMNRGSGLITKEDLANYQPVMRTPLTGKFKDYDIIAMPPPSSGGIAILEIIGIMEAWYEKHPETNWNDFSFENPESIQLLIEAMKYAYADRAEHLGDPDYNEVPVSTLLSKIRAQQNADQIGLNQTKPWKEYGSALPVEDGGTSHVSVIDRLGNAVACTETINTHYGSYVVVPEFGIVLNNEMDDFTSQPGKPNVFGLIQSKSNQIEPGKKPLSSMSPTILVRNEKAEFAAGASGGPRIISSTLQVLLRMALLNQTPRQAVSESRIHHQWLPDQVDLEEGLFEKTGSQLRQKGHKVVKAKSLGAVQAVWRSPRGVLGGSDPRKNGSPAGF